MKLNEQGNFLIRCFEGLRLDSYLDLGGIPTIGYGHTGKDVKHPMSITKERALELFIKDVESVESKLVLLVPDSLNSNQWSALVSFCFNLGVGAFSSSKLHKYVVLKQFDKAAGEFGKWVHVGGVVVNGLVRRREAERKLFISKEGLV